MNLPNTGQIANLPLNSIVETPGILSGLGALPAAMGALPEGAAEFMPARAGCRQAVRGRGGGRRPAESPAVPAAGPGDHRPGCGEIDPGRLPADLQGASAYVLEVILSTMFLPTNNGGAEAPPLLVEVNLI